MSDFKNLVKFLQIQCYCSWREGVPVIYWLSVFSGDIISCGGACCLQNFTSENLALDFWKEYVGFERIYNSFIGCSDLSDFRNICPTQFWADDEPIT